MRTAVPLLLLALATPAPGLEVRVHPGRNGIYLYEVDARRGLSTAMIHNLAVLQHDGPALRLTGLSIDLRAGDRIRQTLRFDGDDLAKAAVRMTALEKAGVLDLYDFAFQRTRYLGGTTTLASTETDEPGSALIMSSIPLLVPSGVDSMRIVAKATDPDGKAVEASLDVPLRPFRQTNDFTFPLRGA